MDYGGREHGWKLLRSKSTLLFYCGNDPISDVLYEPVELWRSFCGENLLVCLCWYRYSWFVEVFNF